MANKHLRDGTLGWYYEDNKTAGTYGYRLMDSTPANTITYASGDYIGSFPIPIERPALIDRGVFNSFDYSNLKAGAKTVEFTIKYLLYEGAFLWYALGGVNSEGGVDDAYTHTIAGLLPSAGVVLPSRTFHIEMVDDLTTDKFIDVCGCVIQSVDIGGTAKDPGVYVTEKIVGQRITDEGGDTDIGEDHAVTAAVDFTNAPVYLDTALTVEDFYYLEYIKLNISGGGQSDITKDIVGWNINITNELVPRRSNAVGSDNYGRTINNYVGAYYIKSRRYTITLNVLPTDETIVLLDSMQDQITDNVVDIGFTRTKAADSVENTIVWNFDNNPAVCPVSDITGMVNFALGNDQTWTFVLNPKTLVGVTITDDVVSYDVHEGHE